jgi:hypothetical protein
MTDDLVLVSRFHVVVILDPLSADSIDLHKNLPLDFSGSPSGEPGLFSAHVSIGRQTNQGSAFVLAGVTRSGRAKVLR